MNKKEYTTCPNCNSKHIEEHGTNDGDFHWWLCRECGKVWDEKEDEKSEH